MDIEKAFRKPFRFANKEFILQCAHLDGGNKCSREVRLKVRNPFGKSLEIYFLCGNDIGMCDEQAFKIEPFHTYALAPAGAKPAVVVFLAVSFFSGTGNSSPNCFRNNLQASSSRSSLFASLKALRRLSSFSLNVSSGFQTSPR